jgi:uncharacterized membrane protein
MFQETHLDDNGLSALESKWFGKTCGSSFSSSSGGLATLISHRFSKNDSFYNFESYLIDQGILVVKFSVFIFQESKIYLY